MLEHVKEGDLVVFKNGQEAFVTKVSHLDDYSFCLYFSKNVCCFLKGDKKSSSWLYDESGKWYRDSDSNLEEYNDIVKVASC